MAHLTRRLWMGHSLALAGVAWQSARAETAELVCSTRTLARHAVADAAAEPAQVVTALRIHPQGQWIFTAGDRHQIDVWDAVAGQHVATLAGHTDWVRSLTLNASGEMLASTGNDGRILLWDTATRERCSELPGRGEACAAIEFNPAENQLAVATWSGRVHLIDVASQNTVHTFDAAGPDLRAVVFSSDGKLLAAGGRSGRIHVWQVAERSLLLTEPAHSQRVRSLIFSADNAGLLSAGDDGSVKLTSLSAGFRGFHLPQQECRIYAMAICHDNQIATAGSDNCIRLWNGSTRELVGEIGRHSGTVAALDCVGDTLVSGGYDTQVRVWHLPATGESARAAERVSARPSFRVEAIK